MMLFQKQDESNSVFVDTFNVKISFITITKDKNIVVAFNPRSSALTSARVLNKIIK